MALILTVMLVVVLQIDEGAALVDTGPEPCRLALGYWIGALGWGVLFYGLRAWHRSKLGLFAAAYCGAAAGGFAFMIVLLPEFAEIAWVLIGVVCIVALVPAALVASLQRLSDRRHGLT